METAKKNERAKKEVRETSSFMSDFLGENSEAGAKVELRAKEAAELLRKVIISVKSK